MESSPQVNLYIETTVHGPRQQGGRWMYLLEFVTRRGDPVTLWKVGDWEAEKENVLIMQALSAALDRLRLPCVINAHAGSSQSRFTPRMSRADDNHIISINEIHFILLSLSAGEFFPDITDLLYRISLFFSKVRPQPIHTMWKSRKFLPPGPLPKEPSLSSV